MLYNIVNWIFWGFIQLDKTCEEVAMGFTKLWWAFFLSSKLKFWLLLLFYSWKGAMKLSYKDNDMH